MSDMFLYVSKILKLVMGTRSEKLVLGTGVKRSPFLPLRLSLDFDSSVEYEIYKMQS